MVQSRREPLARVRWALALGLVPLAALSLVAQDPSSPGTAPRAVNTPTFDAASVKLNHSGARAQSTRIAGSSFTGTNMRMAALIVFAYGIRPERIVGAPAWFEQDRFDISARAASGASESDIRLMVRSLLADRFELRLRTEVRDQPVYALIVDRRDGRLGPALRPSNECQDVATWLAASTDPRSRDGSVAMRAGAYPCTTVSGADGQRGERVFGGARPLGALVDALQGATRGAMVDRPIVDRTGLTGTYDFDLRFAARYADSVPGDPAAAPPLNTALVEQLGLRLEETRGPVEFLVIDGVERPMPD